ncbi:ankyrin repeat domain-containing protein [Candidatus Jidaibacter acanthamoebae]|nr:ankyrin repeat domain-containing protein [Candidatus Jidaibacter acanthamoeba]
MLGNRELNYNFVRAVDNGNIEKAKQLLLNGADVNAKGEILEDTALQIATERGNMKMVELLLAQPNIENDFESLQNALYNGYGNVARKILEHKPELAKMAIDGENPLQSSILTGDKNLISDLIPLLIKYGADVNIRNENGRTPLHLAAHHGLRDACALLLKQEGIIVDAADKKGYTPLHHAASAGKIGCCRILLEKGADPERTVKDKNIIDLCNNLYPNKAELLKDTIKKVEAQKLRKRKVQDNEVAIDQESSLSDSEEQPKEKKVKKWAEEEDKRLVNNGAVKVSRGVNTF